jgi:hypothetical protein
MELFCSPGNSIRDIIPLPTTDFHRTRPLFISLIGERLKVQMATQSIKEEIFIDGANLGEI